MTTLFDINEATAGLIEQFEARFFCAQGEPKAFFEIPQRDGNPVRAIYVTYMIRGQTLVEVRDYFIKAVIQPLAELAQLANERADEAAGPFLYWRLIDKLEIGFEAGWFTIRTRIAVLDNALEPVVLDDMVKQEGVLPPMCAYSAGVKG